MSVQRRTLWVKWSHEYIMKNRSIWKIKVPTDCSWTWRKLLKLRENVQPLIRYKVESGETVSLWYDNWHPQGPLIKKYGDRILYGSRLGDEATANQVIDNGDWHWRNNNTITIQHFLNNTPFNSNLR